MQTMAPAKKAEKTSFSINSTSVRGLDKKKAARPTNTKTPTKGQKNQF